MRRDIDLIRLLLLQTESKETLEAMSRYTTEQALYHSALAIEAGLVKGAVRRNAEGQPAEVVIQRLTWAGHDFLDSARNEGIWKKAKTRILEAGGAWTFDLLKTLLVELAKKNLLP
jgi:hypothetical protein